MGREPSLSNQVVEALLNNETYFFRDRAPFDLLSAHALPSSPSAAHRAGESASGRPAARPARKPIAWRCCSPRASRRGAAGPSTSSATDVSGSVIDRARSGIYTQFEVQRGLGIQQMIRWFEECDGGWRAVEPLRKPIRFQVHNLLERPPHPGEFDIVLCRNVLLYLSPEKRTLAFERLASAMAPDGWLMLGAGETVIGQTRKLAADTKARGLYRLVEPAAAVEVPAPRAAAGA